MTLTPDIDHSAPLQFVVNGAAGSSDADSKRTAIETALAAAGRCGDVLFSLPADLPRVAHQAAALAAATHTAVVAVGGDGTINTVAQAAHALGCAMGVVPQGTFNYFARTHGIPADTADAVAQLLACAPVPVQVAAVNERVFLVNASLGLYPELLEEREAYKARFGRSRWVAFWAAGATLLRAQRKLRLTIEHGGVAREVKTLTLFVGNNRLQLERVGVHAEDLSTRPTNKGHVTAVMLRPIGTLAMIRLMLQGAMGSLGEAQSVDHFEFERMRVSPTLVSGRRGVKVAFDGEVAWMRAPLNFRVLDKPLYLLKPPAPEAASSVATHRAGTVA